MDDTRSRSSSSVVSRLLSVFRRKKKIDFTTSGDYWEQRYAQEGSSGAGSRGPLAEFKRDVLNGILAKYGIESAIEFGCGDGHQLGMIDYPKYQGFDVSASVVDRCREQYQSDSTKSFGVIGDHSDHTADLGLSLDVIYHLVEDNVFDNHMSSVFSSAERYVVVYSTDNELPADAPQPDHIRHRRFTDWIREHASDWQQIDRIPNAVEGYSADFFVFEKQSQAVTSAA